MDSLYAAVVHDLSSRYCPVDRAAFFVRFGIVVAGLVAIALLLFASAAREREGARRRELLHIGACAIALFAAGYGASIAFGLSGCTAGTQAGLVWDWPF